MKEYGIPEPELKTIWWWETTEEDEITKALENLGYKPYKFKIDGKYPGWSDLGETYLNYNLQVKNDLIDYVIKNKLYKNGGDVSKDSTEYLIDQELQPLIEKVRNRAIMPDYRYKFSDYDVFGLIVSKYCRWDFNNLKTVMVSALEDSNFRDLTEEVSKWNKGGILNKKYSLKDIFTK